MARAGEVGRVAELVRLDRLRVAEWNANRVPPGVLAKVRRSIEEFGFVENLVARPLADGSLEVLSGNHRLLLLREMGVEAAPVVVVELGDADARILAQALNRTRGRDDPEAYAELLEAVLAEVDARRVAEFLPESETSIERILGNLKPPAGEDEFTVPVGPPRSVFGEVYELGPHRVMCGDSREKGAVAALVGSCAPEVLWTDPPYGVDYVGKTAAALTMVNDGADGLRGLLAEAFAAADDVLAPGARFYIAAPAGPRGTDFRLAIDGAGWLFHQTLVWVKDVFVLGHSDYHYRHEDILYGWKPGDGRVGRGLHAGTRWQGDHSQDSVFEVARPKRSEEHPTMKPVDLIAAHLRNSSQLGDGVLDLFGGSGSTLIAAEQTGRRAFLMEMDPWYCDVIRNRYEAVSGNGA